MDFLKTLFEIILGKNLSLLLDNVILALICSSRGNSIASKNDNIHKKLYKFCFRKIALITEIKILKSLSQVSFFEVHHDTSFCSQNNLHERFNNMIWI